MSAVWPTSLETTPDKVTAIATSMGLPPQGEIPEILRERAYITIVRRNWHLLPYDQLLTLLNISAEEFGFRLQEDDFLFIKLGSLKPRCAPSPTRNRTKTHAGERRRFVRSWSRSLGSAVRPSG